MSENYYKGEKLKTLEESKQYNVDPYLPSDKLVQSVKLAQILQRPLLVKGEPGCGKSRLAEAVAIELFGKEYRNNFFKWNVKSTSKAQDGLYSINNLQRLSDANIRSNGQRGEINLEINLPPDEHGHYKAVGNYIKLGVLGQAFVHSWKKDIAIPPVVLIDEVDKADIDFPNDLLMELDNLAFQIPEIIGESGSPIEITANPNNKPLIIITSNDEKPLPAAFLRRCLFHYIDFKEINLNAIISARFPKFVQHDKVSRIIELFAGWRKKIKEESTSRKNITTGELLDWLRIVQHDWVEGSQPVFEDSNRPVHMDTLLKDEESLRAFMNN
ncbi:MoxR family ATPase [Chitinophaga sp.]|uniref:AAA family ATPase n=1 Tax=Chitinophaga sp. TaxID=1869181 RepID=UPI0031DA832C